MASPPEQSVQDLANTRFVQTAVQDGVATEHLFLVPRLATVQKQKRCGE
ncbi:TPA: hypothetical protein ACIAIE_005422 [Serratia fonticola]